MDNHRSKSLGGASYSYSCLQYNNISYFFNISLLSPHYRFRYYKGYTYKLHLTLPGNFI